MIKKLDRYIIGKFLTTFFFSIMVLVVISCVIDLSEKIDNITQKKASLSTVLHYYMDFVPHITALLFHLFIFIATIFFTSKMAYKSEIIAILSSGVSFQRFLRPYFIGGGFLCLISLVANHWVIPIANKGRVAFEDKYINDGNYAIPGENVHLAYAKNAYVYFRNFNFSNNQGLGFTAEKVKGTLLTEKLMADDIVYDTTKKTWRLHNVVVRRNDTLKEQVTHIAEMEINYPFKPKDLNRNEALKEALTTPELNEFIATESLRGRENLNMFYVERDRRTSQPFAGLILTVMGACLANRKIRGGSGFHLALGIAISAIYVMFMQFSTTLSTKASLDPLISVWIPNFIFAGIAYFMYRRQIK